MTPEQYEGLIQSVSDQIKITVNGKIDKINTKLDAYIVDDNEWKKTAKPVIEMGKNLQGFGVVALYILTVLAALGGAIKATQFFFFKR